MAEDKVTVKARIEKVVSCVPTHKIIRDPEGEKRVKEDLQKALKAEGLDLKPEDKDFQSRYRTKLRAYAKYMDGFVDEKGPAEGGPALMVPQKAFDNELQLSYQVDGKEYTKTVNHYTKSKCLEKGMDFYITVSPKQPMTILKQSVKDYREAAPQSSGEGGGLFMVLLIAAFMIVAALMGK